MGLDNAAVSRLRLTWEVMRLLPFPLLPPVLAHPGILASSLSLALLGSLRLEEAPIQPQGTQLWLMDPVLVQMGNKAHLSGRVGTQVRSQTWLSHFTSTQ